MIEVGLHIIMVVVIYIIVHLIFKHFGWYESIR